jgi:4-oxalocrotonate tautomerase
MIEGRTEEQKRAVIEKVSAALVEATGAPIANVRVWIQEVPKENWGIAGVSAKDLGR